MAKTKWDRKLGTSKREQGIATPKRSFAENRRLVCGCWIERGQVYNLCRTHQALVNIQNGAANA